jgi:hypothetical protein
VLCDPAAPPAAAGPAIRWGLRDPHEAVRIAAVQFGMPRATAPPDLMAAGLADPASGVRAAAAAAAARHGPRGAFAMLVAALGREADPDAFRSMHRALSAVSGRDLTLPFDGERNASTRAELVRQWQSELERAGSGTSGP